MVISWRTLEKELWHSTNFLVVHISTTVLGHVAPEESGMAWKIFQVLNCIFLLSQGFLNMLTHTAPEWQPWLAQKRDHWWGQG